MVSFAPMSELPLIVEATKLVKVVPAFHGHAVYLAFDGDSGNCSRLARRRHAKERAAICPTRCPTDHHFIAFRHHVINTDQINRSSSPVAILLAHRCSLVLWTENVPLTLHYL
jgi:hypothetical protein